MSAKIVVKELSSILENYAGEKAPSLLPTIRAIGSVCDEKYSKRLDLWDKDVSDAPFPNTLNAEEERITDVAFAIEEIVSTNLYCGYRESAAITAYNEAIEELKSLGLEFQPTNLDLSCF